MHEAWDCFKAQETRWGACMQPQEEAGGSGLPRLSSANSEFEAGLPKNLPQEEKKNINQNQYSIVDGRLYPTLNHHSS